MRAAIFVACAVGALGAPVFDKSATVVSTQSALIEAVNAANTTWTAGANGNWADHKWSDVAYMCGSKAGGPKLPKRVATAEDLAVAGAPPKSFDPRTKWTQCPSLLEIRDQAACGSCWAFGAVESMTDRICIASNGTKQAHVSAQEMNSCCTSCGGGCGGGFPESAWQYWQETGVVTGANYNVSPTLCSPYSIPSCDHHLVHPKITPCGNEGPTPACVQQCVDGEVWKATKSYGQAPYSLDMSTIYNELMTHGPVESSFTVYSDFVTYTGGVYQHVSGTPLGGHAIKIMGWGELAGTPYWIVANSWNPDWGLNGYFYILRGQDECGIEDGFVAGLVA